MGHQTSLRVDYCIAFYRVVIHITNSEIMFMRPSGTLGSPELFKLHVLEVLENWGRIGSKSSVYVQWGN
jgi:hypothetical protein